MPFTAEEINEISQADEKIEEEFVKFLKSRNADYQRKYRARNKIKVLKQQKRYYEAHKIEVALYRKKYYQGVLS